jgi:hypothetical protein
MGYFANYSKRRRELTGRESAETLEHMQVYFQDGTNWTQGMYENASGARCLVGAANHVRVSPIDDAKHFLRMAIAEIAPGVARIEDFNDTRRTYAEVAVVIERAKQLAAQSVVRALPAPVVEILPPERQALPAPVVASPRPGRVRPRRSLAGWIMD